MFHPRVPAVSTAMRARRCLELACLGAVLTLPATPSGFALGQDQPGGADRPPQQPQQDPPADQPADEPSGEPSEQPPPDDMPDDMPGDMPGDQTGDQPAAPTDAQRRASGDPVALPPELVPMVDDFYHAATVGNYTAAQAFGEQLLAGNYPPQQVLDAFIEVTRRRSPDTVELDRQLLNWQRAEPIAGVSAEIAKLINQGRVERATDPAFIAEQIERLSRGQRAYINARDLLRNSGEYAVPVMIEYLTDPERAEFHADIRRVMRELGVDMLNPLWAATKMEDQQVLASLLIVLGDLGYDWSIPYLLELAETSKNEAVRRAAELGLKRLGYDGGSNAAAEFYRLGEKFFYGQTEVGPNRRLGTATIWAWGGQQRGLVRTDVPPQIFDEIMTMRAAGNALTLGQDQDDALALWLAGNYRREGEMAEGEIDATQPEGSPSAHYYGAQAGTRYLQMVLSRAEQDRQRLASGSRYNAADLSLRAIKSLQEITGRENVGAGETPLTTAMNFPDRRVRIEAAFALAQSLPMQEFAGKEQVVPLLADALSQTGQPSLLVVTPDQEMLNSTVEQLKSQDYRAVGSTSVIDAVAQAQQLPSVDVIVIDSELGDAQVNRLLADAQSNPKLNGAAKLILVNSEASRYEAMKQSDGTIATSTVREGEGLTEAIEQARTALGGLPLDPEAATELALRSGNLLKLVGTSNSVFQLETGEQFLLAALDDARPEVRMLAGEVVALLKSPQAQPALLASALRPETAPEVRISLLNSLATSAKLFGNRLESEQVDSLLAAAANREDLDVQASAAEAVGAMNLPADQARRLIIEQTQSTELRRPGGGEAETAGSSDSLEAQSP